MDIRLCKTCLDYTKCEVVATKHNPMLAMNCVCKSRRAPNPDPFKKVNFYRVEVKYSGRYENYSKDDLYKMAVAKTDAGVDPFSHTKIMTEEEAKEFVGKVWTKNSYPCNHLADVCWAEYESSEDKE